MDDAPIDSGLLRAAVSALHEAHGTPVTRCATVNDLMRQYPDCHEGTVAYLLQFHDAGMCDCA